MRHMRHCVIFVDSCGFAASVIASLDASRRASRHASSSPRLWGEARPLGSRDAWNDAWNDAWMAAANPDSVCICDAVTHVTHDFGFCSLLSLALYLGLRGTHP
jgi:hypothetical protein